ncbi:hypothetical protein [Bartonella sp. B41]
MKFILKNLKIVLLGGIIIVGCGRKGALEFPSTTVVDISQRGRVSKSRIEKPFILDWLIR